jgi:DNA-binding transcriptional ArsR family regulator
MTLARRHTLSPSGVSAHLTALRNAGLVSSRRHRREMLYTCSALGHALLGTSGDRTSADEERSRDAG